MTPTLTGSATNDRVRRVRSAAALAGVEINFNSIDMSKPEEWKNEDFLSKNPFGFLPILELENGTILRESAAIAEYLADGTSLIPSDKNQRALVHQWGSTADQELQIPASLANRQLKGLYPYNKPNFDGIIKKINERLSILDNILINKTWLIGERITLADILIGSSLSFVFSTVIDSKDRVKIPNVIRYYETFVNHPKLLDIYNPINLIDVVKPPSKK
ncbi:uncharacterized protein L201_000907 [Kwoniella dendrophila CBS 6074]|uniref:Glutathione S-transferase n=1 Tax=Kwoniella dendrophila CBS 6074 TaxID=1295534 RepID=A0AAX4JKY2_9TREE